MLAGAFGLLCVSGSAFGQAVLNPTANGSYAAELQKLVYDEMGWVDGDPRFIEGVRFNPREPAPPTGPGFEVTLTWSFVPDGTFIPGTIPAAFNPFPEGSALFATLDNFFPRDEWLARFERSFDRWEDISGINFIFVDDTTTGFGNLGAASPTPPPGTDPEDYEPVDAGDPWPAPPFTVIEEGDGPLGYYDPGGMINPDPDNPIPMPNFSVGDIRIGARSWDGPTEPDGSGAGAIFVDDPPPAGTFGNPEDGNIILDTAEVWSDPLAPNFLEITVTRAVAFAVGLNTYCPKSQPSVLEIQDGIDPVGGPWDPDANNQPFPQLSIVEPQLVDILAVQKLYGDPLESTDSYASAIAHQFDFDFDEESGQISLTPFSNGFVPLSITEKWFMGAPTPDVDFYTFDVPLLVSTGTLTVTITPQGTNYQSAETEVGADGIQCSGEVSTFDAARQDNPSIRLETFDPQTNVLEVLAEVNSGGAGDTEVLTYEVTPGRYYLIIEGDPANSDDPLSTHVQTYDIDFSITVNDQVSGLPLGDVLDGDDNATGIGRDVFVDVPTQDSVILDYFVPEIEAASYVGDSSVIVFMDKELPFAGHSAFNGRSLTSLFWPGVNSSIDVIGSHATATVASAGGVSVPQQNFLGAAEPSHLASVNIARPGTLINGLFPVSLEAVYYSLFGLTDPELSADLGLSSPADIFVAVWNAPFSDPLGAGPTALAHDAAASMRDVLVIASGGNAGNVNNIDDPVECGPLSIGDLFVGARSIGTPASAHNTFIVGACGHSVINPSVLSPDYRLVPRVQSKGPLPSFSPNAIGGDISVDNARSGLHIVAPGYSFIQEAAPLPPDPTDLEVCGYPGNQPAGFINLPILSDTADPNAFGTLGGSSIAASIVAGSAALLRDAALEQGLSADPLVMKAVLMNSAVKQPGWTNQAAISAPYPPHDKITTLRSTPLPPQIVNFSGQALDYAQGAGVINLEQAFLQYFLGARDVIETDVDLPTVSQFTVPSGGEPPIPEAMLMGGRNAIMLARADLMADRLSPEPEFFQQAQLGTPSGPPAPGFGGNFTPRPPAVPPDIGNAPGPGDPGFDPIGERTIRFFFEFNGLSDPDDFNSPAFPFDDDINEDPLALTSTEVDGAQRLYVWAQYLGSDVTQDWNQVSLNVGSTGDVEIVEHFFFNYELADFSDPQNPVVLDRWDETDQGEQVDPGRIENINLVAFDEGVGLTTDITVLPFDGHFDLDTGSTLIGYIEVVGEGEIFLEVGEGTVANEEDEAEDAKVLFGFGDEFEPPISGADVALASSIRDAGTTITAVLPVPVPVKVIGWDRGNLGVRALDLDGDGTVDPGETAGFIDYFIEEPIIEGQSVIATLVWDRLTVVEEPDLTNLDDPGAPVTPIQLELENLDIDFLACDEFGNPLVDGEGVAVTLGATSGTFDNVEHIVMSPPFTTHVLMRVRYAGRHYAVDDPTDDLAAPDPAKVEYALAWGLWNTPILNTPDTLQIPEDNQNLPAKAAEMVVMEDIINAFGTVSGTPGYNAKADLNKDGTVDARDLNILLGELRGGKAPTSNRR